MEPPESSSFTSVIQLPTGLRDSKFIPDKHPGTAHALCHSTLPKHPFPFPFFPSRTHHHAGKHRCTALMDQRVSGWGKDHVCFPQNMASVQMSPWPRCCKAAPWRHILVSGHCCARCCKIPHRQVQKCRAMSPEGTVVSIYILTVCTPLQGGFYLLLFQGSVTSCMANTDIATLACCPGTS